MDMVWYGFLYVLSLPSVSLCIFQCYYKSSGKSLKPRLMFNQLIKPCLTNYKRSEKIHLLFCINIFDPQVPFSHNHYVSLILRLKRNTSNNKRKIPYASVTAPKLNKSAQHSSIKIFLKKDLTITYSN